jgi:chaperonin GroES
MNLNTTLKLSDIVKSPNLVELIEDKQDLLTIGNAVYDAWTIDKTSRQPWEEKTQMAMNLALQVMEDKSFPWEGASNVKFPLVTIAALQYNARAYPTLIPSPDIVKCRVVGEDPDGIKQARADRVASHMSFQLLEEDEAWEENMDKVLITQPIVGCAFKKTWYDPNVGHNQSVNILAKDLYIPYFAQSLEKASRITEVLYYSENDMYEKYNSGIFVDWNKDIKPQDSGDDILEDTKEKAQGLTKPTDDPSQPYELLEQHTFLDLDGDGYKEPYVITIRKDTKLVLRIVARFDTSQVEKKNGKIVKITADHYYTKFPFIPSPDGGIYDIGFGVLLGPLNESINTALNQLIDAGTLSNTAGGFLGRGVKIKSGDNSFKPFEWKRVDSTGDDLRKGVFPLPVREPSMVLFQLLSLMIEYGERIGMATDPMVGVNLGQNTPAETSRNMIQQGEKIFSAIYKRTHRALKQELRKWYKLNRYFLEEKVEFYNVGSQQGAIVLREDYITSEKDIIPVSDPNMVSDEAKVKQAFATKDLAMSGGGFNMYEVDKRVLQAMKVQDIDKVLPDPTGPNAIKQGPSEKVLIESMKQEGRKLDVMIKAQQEAIRLMNDYSLTQAKITELEASAVLHLASAEAASKGQEIAAIQSAIGIAKQQQEERLRTVELLRDMAKLDFEKEKVGLEKKDDNET